MPNPLSQPPTCCHAPSEMPSPRPRLGMRYEEPSWRLPYTKYGARVSTCTWYIWAIGSTMRMKDRPRLSVMLAPPSCHHEAVGIQRIDPDVVVVAAAFVARA